MPLKHSSQPWRNAKPQAQAVIAAKLSHIGTTFAFSIPIPRKRRSLAEREAEPIDTTTKRSKKSCPQKRWRREANAGANHGEGSCWADRPEAGDNHRVHGDCAI